MGEKSIDTELGEKLGINREEVTALISVYEKKHGGKVDINQIAEDVENIVNEMVYNIGYTPKHYDVKHEILDCGKDRVEQAINNLIGEDDNILLAQQYLKNRYSDNVHIWAETFYHASQKSILEILDEGIDEYRNFVNGLPYKNINKVASALDTENEVTKFLALNGTEEDFQKFMTSVEYINNKGFDRKSCPKDLSSKLFGSIKEAIKDNTFDTFKRKNIMKGLATIYNDEMLVDSQKEQLQDIFISQSLSGKADDEFNKLVMSKIPEKLDVVKEYTGALSDASWEKKCEYLTQKILPTVSNDMSLVYNNLIEKFEKELQEDNLKPTDVIELLKNSKLSCHDRNELEIVEDEKTKMKKLSIYLDNPITKVGMHVELDGTKLSDVINKVNDNSLNTATKQLEKFSEQGIGEVSIKEMYNFEWRELREYPELEFALGKISAEEDSPYVLGGNLTNRDGLEDLQMKVPYHKIESLLYIKNEIAEMTPEQIEKFNHKSEPIKVTKRFNSEKQKDGRYHTDIISDFEINEEKYHFKNTEYRHGGEYIAVWKGEEENHPNKAFGVSFRLGSPYFKYSSEDSEEKLMKFVSENPMRFSEYYNIHADKEDWSSDFPSKHIQTLCRDIMRMPKESEIIEMLDKELKSVDEENKEQKIANESKEEEKLILENKVENKLQEEPSELSQLSEEKQKLVQLSEKAKELFEEYEELDKDEKNIGE